MKIINVNIVYQVVLLLYFGYGTWMYYKNSKSDFVLLYKILRGGSEVDFKININNLKTKSSLFLGFLLSYLISVISIVSEVEDNYFEYFNIFFFISVLILMSLFYFYPSIKSKIIYYRSILNPIFNPDLLDQSISNDMESKINSIASIQKINDSDVATTISSKVVFKSHLNIDELKEQYDYRINKGDFNISFDDFISFAYGKKINNKITWLSEVNNGKLEGGGKGNKKISKFDLLDMYKILFTVDFEKMKLAEMTNHANYYFSFKSENFPDEKEMSGNSFSTWRNK